MSKLKHAPSTLTDHFGLITCRVPCHAVNLAAATCGVKQYEK